jgi:hypothetical protein
LPRSTSVRESPRPRRTSSVRGCMASARDSCARSSCRSMIRTPAPSACSWAASVSPVGPAPTTSTSGSACAIIFTGSSPWPPTRMIAASLSCPRLEATPLATCESTFRTAFRGRLARSWPRPFVDDGKVSPAPRSDSLERVSGESDVSSDHHHRRAGVIPATHIVQVQAATLALAVDEAMRSEGLLFGAPAA